MPKEIGILRKYPAFSAPEHCKANVLLPQFQLKKKGGANVPGMGK
jgi:hypothetical protein